MTENPFDWVFVSPYGFVGQLQNAVPPTYVIRPIIKGGRSAISDETLTFSLDADEGRILP